jgi:hypothetical protein
MNPAETARRFVRDYCRPPSKEAEDDAIAALTKLLEQTERKGLWREVGPRSPGTLRWKLRKVGG